MRDSPTEKSIAASSPQTPLPSRYCIDEEIDWNAPWTDVCLWVELPFWLMVDDSNLGVELGGHSFEIAVHEHYFELHAGIVSDSKEGVLYQGPPKKHADLSEGVRNLLNSQSNAHALWRKSKTVLKIKSRCNEYVWKTRIGENGVIENSKRPQAVRRAIDFYLVELCRAHIPVVNRLIQQYRLATYDYFAYEVSPWDVSQWLVERASRSVRIGIVPYREWDIKPRFFSQPFGEILKTDAAGQKIDPPSVPYKLIEAGELQDAMSRGASPGEFELLDALNLMERGDYSGAVRRITTALEVILESVVSKAVESAESKEAALEFVAKTRINFRKRVQRYEAATGRNLSDGMRRELFRTRGLRHKIVHEGYRIAPSERGIAQRAVDTGRWTYNWFENDKGRFEVREKKIAYRGLGRDIAFGIFPATITPDGVVVSKIPV